LDTSIPFGSAFVPLRKKIIGLADIPTKVTNKIKAAILK